MEFQCSVTPVTARKRGSSDEGKHRIFAAAKYSPKWAGLVPQVGEQASHLHGEGTLPSSEWSIQPMDTDVWSQGTWWQENELLPIISSLHKMWGRTLSCNIEFLKSCIQVVSPPWAVNPGFWAQMCSDEVFSSSFSPSHPRRWALRDTTWIYPHIWLIDRDRGIPQIKVEKCFWFMKGKNEF